MRLAGIALREDCGRVYQPNPRQLLAAGRSGAHGRAQPLCVLERRRIIDRFELLQPEVKDVLRLLEYSDIAQLATHFQQGPAQDRQRHEEVEVTVLSESHSRARRLNPTRSASALPATA
jgi:hypothetical protein